MLLYAPILQLYAYIILFYATLTLLQTYLDQHTAFSSRVWPETSPPSPLGSNPFQTRLLGPWQSRKSNLPSLPPCFRHLLACLILLGHCRCPLGLLLHPPSLNLTEQSTRTLYTGSNNYTLLTARGNKMMRTNLVSQVAPCCQDTWRTRMGVRSRNQRRRSFARGPEMFSNVCFEKGWLLLTGNMQRLKRSNSSSVCWRLSSPSSGYVRTTGRRKWLRLTVIRIGTNLLAVASKPGKLTTSRTRKSNLPNDPRLKATTRGLPNTLAWRSLTPCPALTRRNYNPFHALVLSPQRSIHNVKRYVNSILQVICITQIPNRLYCTNPSLYV